MLHAVPELLDALEVLLLKGEDPTKLLTSIRWSELVGWPEDEVGARALKRRANSIQSLLNGLQSPLRAALLGLSGSAGYSRHGGLAENFQVPARLREKV